MSEVAHEKSDKRPQQRRKPSSAALLIHHFFSGTLWGIIGGVIIVTAFYVSIVRNESTSIQNVHVKGNQSLSSYEIGKNVATYLSRLPEVIVPYPNQIFQSGTSIGRFLQNKYPEIATINVSYKNFNDLYIDITEYEARIVHCNSIPLEEVSCWQRSANGRPLLKTPQNDFDTNPKLNTTLRLKNNILPSNISEEVLQIYQNLSTSSHKIRECTFDKSKPEFVCSMMTSLFGVISVYVDSASLKKIVDSQKPIIDVVLKNIPKETLTLSYIDLRFYPKIVYK